jgi:hypothetical protein
VVEVGAGAETGAGVDGGGDCDGDGDGVVADDAPLTAAGAAAGAAVEVAATAAGAGAVGAAGALPDWTFPFAASGACAPAVDAVPVSSCFDFAADVLAGA